MVKQQLTEEEVIKLQQLQQKTDIAIQELGKLALSKLNLKKQYKSVKQDLEVIDQERSILAKELQEKYGDGSINLATKEFTPS